MFFAMFDMDPILTVIKRRAVLRIVTPHALVDGRERRFDFRIGHVRSRRWSAPPTRLH